MAFGGSLNREGTEYYRILKAADNTVGFLENLKQYLSVEEQKTLNKTIEIVTNHVNKLSDGKIKDT